VGSLQQTSRYIKSAPSLNYQQGKRINSHNHCSSHFVFSYHLHISPRSRGWEPDTNKELRQEQPDFNRGDDSGSRAHRAGISGLPREHWPNGDLLEDLLLLTPSSSAAAPRDQYLCPRKVVCQLRGVAVLLCFHFLR
jgi:hypothetical protein